MIALTNMLVSMTRRFIRTNGDSIFQNISEYFLGHTAARGFGADAVHRLLKLVDVVSANALIFFGGHDYGHVAVLAENQHRLTLGGVEESREALFGFGSRYGSHTSILDKLDKMDKYKL